MSGSLNSRLKITFALCTLIPIAACDEWDSLNHLKIITAVEQEYHVSLMMGEIELIDCIRRLHEVINTYNGSDATL